MSFDDGLDIDIPVPPLMHNVQDVKDRFDFDVAFNLAFVGCGQGGSRIAETFDKLGYGRTAAINTTVQDLKDIALADHQKLDIGGGGANKDPERAAAQMVDKEEDVFDLLKACWGEAVDYGFVCLGAGGGTGAGISPAVVNVARRYMAETNRPTRVGAIIALPRNMEGQRPARNTVRTLQSLRALNLSPIIIIDNQRIYDLYRNRISVGSEHRVYNQNVCQLLHLFNRLAAQSSEHTSFDRADFGKLLDSGLLAFGAGEVPQWKTESDVTKVIREQLKQNVLVSSDLSQGNLAALIYVLGGAAYDEVPVGFRDHGVQMLTRILAQDSTIFQGIFRASSDTPSFKIAAMVGGLQWPSNRIAELATLAGVSHRDIADFLGV
jgi:cell division GTPase FtsZ